MPESLESGHLHVKLVAVVAIIFRRRVFVVTQVTVQIRAVMDRIMGVGLERLSALRYPFRCAVTAQAGIGPDGLGRSTPMAVLAG